MHRRPAPAYQAPERQLSCDLICGKTWGQNNFDKSSPLHLRCQMVLLNQAAQSWVILTSRTCGAFTMWMMQLAHELDLRQPLAVQGPLCAISAHRCRGHVHSVCPQRCLYNKARACV